MQAHGGSFEVKTRGKGTYEITDQVARIVRASGVRVGTVTVFVRHTSASLVIFENADPSARADLEAFFERLVPEDSTSHIRMVLTRSNEVVPVIDGRMQLGTWQGIFLFEHRRAPHTRQIAVSVVGSA
jgi:secondary thiamine-phosphate synthase enzyme